jgi:acyl transferase domain-containing protein/acyl carrier protein
MILSKDGHNRSFDSESSGTVSGEGAGAVVLKRYTKALEDGDQIYAIIKGSAINNDGDRKVGFTAPSVDGQSDVIRLAHQAANVNPESISYIEAHGTATKLGDPIEVLALTQAFGKNGSKHYCALGSVKSNIGHLDTAAGVAGFIKTVLCLKNKTLVPSLHYTTPNPEINFKESPFYVNTELKNWQVDNFPLRAGVSSFGIGGTNAHVIVEEAPLSAVRTEAVSYELIPLSAKTSGALKRQQENLKRFLEVNKSINLGDVAWTLQNRKVFSHRSSFVAQTIGEAIESLENTKGRTPQLRSIINQEKKVVFMFSGQGSQYENMGLDLYTIEGSVFKKTIDECFELSKQFTTIDFKKILYPIESDKSTLINETINTQPILFMFEYSLAKEMEYYGIVPDEMIGHSIGEYVAACFSGVLTLADALKMVIKRSALMQSLPKGSMLAVNSSVDQIKKYLTKEIDLAALNSPDNCVVSGSTASINALVKRLEKDAVQSKLLQTSHAFHSSQMEPMLEEFLRSIESIEINSARIPYLSNLTGKRITVNNLKEKKYWSDHIRGTVKFSEGIDELLSQGDSVFIEIGPGNSLTNFVHQHLKENKTGEVYSLIRRHDRMENGKAFFLNTISSLWESGLDIKLTHLVSGRMNHKLSLPTYPFEKIKYPVGEGGLKAVSERILQLNEEKRLDESQWYYEPSWKSAPLNFEIHSNPTEQYLVFCDQGEVGIQMVGLLRKIVDKIVVVRIGSNYKKTDDNVFEINPYHYEDYEELFNELKKKNIHTTHIIHLMSLEQDVSELARREDIEKNKVFGFYSLLHITKELSKFDNQAPLNLAVITNNLEDIFSGKIIHPSKAIVNGIITVIAQENPFIKCKLIDLSEETIQAEGIVNLIKEVRTEIQDRFIVYRNNIRWIRDYNPVKISSSNSFKESKIRNGGTYLITGGLGNLGFILAKHLLKRYNANLILVGRINLSQLDLNDDLTAYENKKHNRLRELKQIGSVSYHAVNSLDLFSMQEVIEKSESEFGRINGVIHAAGLVEGNSFKGMNFISVEECEAQFESKLAGTQVLGELFKNKELDFCLFTSSLSSIIGGKEFSAYASANAYLDYFSRKGIIKNSISINFDGLNFNEQSYIESSLNQSEIVEVFEEILLAQYRPQLIVSLKKLDCRIKKWVYPTPNMDTSLSEIQSNAGMKRSAIFSATYVEAQSETEKELCQLFQSFFGINEIGIDDDFFELGGDSLKALTIISRIHQKLNVQLRIMDILQHPNIKNLGKEIDSIKNIGQMKSGGTTKHFKYEIEI